MLVMPTAFQFNQAAEVWFDHLARITWQSALLVLVVTVAVGWFRHCPPRVRCWIWRVVALKLLLMPFWTVAVEAPGWLPAAPSQPIGIASVEPTTRELPSFVEAPEVTTSESTSEPSPIDAPITRWWKQLSWQSWLLAVWLVGIAWQVCRIVLQRRELKRLLRGTSACQPEQAQLVAECAHQIGLASGPEVRTTSVAISPFVCGIRRPCLVLPTQLFAEVEREQLRQIVLHELAHLRRRDLAWCWVTQLMLVGYWFHPVAYWVAYQEQLERELACDHEAMTASGAGASEYAATLVEVVSQSASFPLARTAMTVQFDGGQGK